METPKTLPASKTAIWRVLKSHKKAIAKLHMRDLFMHDKHRADTFSLTYNDLLVDYSKHRITGETFSLLMGLANSVHIKTKVSKLFSGEPLNITENRPALHTALRAPADASLKINRTNVVPLIQNELKRISRFVQQLHQGQIKGSTDKPISNVINIGIGGSDLGPRLVADALREFYVSDITVQFVANLDAKDIFRALEKSDPETTLFIITSKSFSTMETRTNAQTAKQWLINNGCSEIDNHFVAISSNKSIVREFGIRDEHIYQLWDWIGGRYSVWSAVGLPVAICLGMDNFSAFLQGAREMDQHFLEVPVEQNIPIVLALLDIWYNNFFQAETQAIVPYDEGLRLLPEYLSQLIMESNGKSVTNRNKLCKQHSAQIIWGSVGSNAQHAFFQLLHQGTRMVPVEFLLPMHSSYDENHQSKLVANCIAQSEALMLGRENTDEPYRHFPGNRPSTTIVYPKLTPKILGMLLAMYEHRTFVQAMIWGINPFDQWGVELGKELAQNIIDESEERDTKKATHDSSTALLINYFLNN